MTPDVSVVIIALLAGLFIFSRLFLRVIVYDFQKGLLYTNGQFQRLLGPGKHYVLRRRSEVHVMDMRKMQLALPGQEILTKDNVNLKLSLIGSYSITDPVMARHAAQNYLTELHSQAQLALRDAVAGYTIDELLEKKNDLDAALLSRTAAAAQGLGLEVSALGVRDIMLPHNLKKAFAGLLEARKDAQTQLERARGEQAVLRNLANAAQLYEASPQLLQARLLQTLSAGGNSLVFHAPESGGEKPAKKAGEGR